MDENNFNGQNNQNNQQYQNINNSMMNPQPEIQNQPMCGQNHYANSVQSVAEQNQFANDPQNMNYNLNSTMPQENNSKKGTKTILIIILLVAVAGIGLIGYLNIPKNDNSVNDNSTTSTGNMSSNDNDISTTTTKVVNQNSSTKNDYNWNEHKVMINGIEIQLPILYSEFVSLTGYKGEERDLTKDLFSDDYTLTFIKDPEDEYESLFSITIRNLTDDEKKASDCYVTIIKQDEWSKLEKAELIFAKNLKVGQKMTEQELFDLFGEPKDIYDYVDGDYVSKTYKYEVNSSLKQCFEVHIFKDQIISYLSLSWK